MGQSFRIDAAAVADGEVVHGECHDGGQPELHHHRQQVQRSGQRGGVQHHDGKVGTGMPDMPVSALTATCSSGLIGAREYVPGVSTNCQFCAFPAVFGFS